MSGMSRLELAFGPPLHETEVEERHGAVVVEPVVAGMRIAVEHAVAIDRALHEAEDHFGYVLALRVGRAWRMNSWKLIRRRPIRS